MRCSKGHENCAIKDDGYELEPGFWIWDSGRGHWIKQEEDRSEEEANDRADEYRMASKEGDR